MRATIDYTRVYNHMSIFLLVTVVMVFNSGCGKHLAGRPDRIQLVENKKPSQLENELIGLEAKYDDPNADTQTRRYNRNLYSRKMIAVIDKRYNDFLDDLVTQRKGLDASADITAIGLGTASTLFTPATTKSILSGLSTMTTASKTAIDKVYFYEQTLPVLIAQMESNRQAVLADIMDGLSAEDDIYPLYRVQRDLSRYFAAGTIDGALAEIQKQAAKKAEEAQVRIQREVEDEIKSGRTRRQSALAMMVDGPSFDKMREAIIEWWNNLDTKKKWEKIKEIAAWASEDGISAESLSAKLPSGKDGPHPDRLEDMLKNLKYNANSRLFLADIVRIAGNSFEFPK
jgi:hypothetical protein